MKAIFFHSKLGIFAEALVRQFYKMLTKQNIQMCEDKGYFSEKEQGVFIDTTSLRKTGNALSNGTKFTWPLISTVKLK